MDRREAHIPACCKTAKYDENETFIKPYLSEVAETFA